MTTTAQVKQVARPLLARNPDLALVGRLVVVKPLRHILRGIYIDRSSAKNLFTPTWFVIFLFEPKTFVFFNWGNRIGRPRPPQTLWEVGDPDVPELIAAEIERIALPLLRPVQTIEDFAAFTAKDQFPYNPLSHRKEKKIFVDIARGDLDSAQALCEYFASDTGKKVFSRFYEEEYKRITQTLCPLVAARDRAGLAKLLHEYEAESVRTLKLDKLWAPTPFPLELES